MLNKKIEVSKYEAINNREKVVKQRVPMLDDKERREKENEIVEQLYRIFTHKVK